MKYVPPIGGDADAPYVDGNPTAGIKGSPVAAAAIEHPQREILAVITEAGLTPNEEYLGQLRDAIEALIAAAVGTITFDPVSAIRDAQAGAVRMWPSLTIPLLADGLPLGLPLDGAVVSLTTYPRLARVLCPSANNGWAPGWYRCTAGGVRDVAGTHIKLDDWRGGHPQVLDAGAARSKSTVLVNTTNGSANVTIANNLSAGGTLAAPNTGSGGIYPGLSVSGTGIPAGATVVSVSGSTVTLSANCTATGTSVEATITGRVLGSWQSDADRRVSGSVSTITAGTPTGPFSSSGSLISGPVTSAVNYREQPLSFDSARVGPTAPTTRPAGPVTTAIILV